MTRIAYLVSEYPAPSHTFIRREIAALRGFGLDIVPFSIRPGSIASGDAGDSAVAVLGRSPLAYPGALLVALARAPARFAGTLGLALRHRPPGLRALIWSLFHFVEAMVLARLLRHAGAGRLHSHFANSGATVGMLAAHYLAMPWSLTLHGISETEYPAGLLLGDKIARACFVACASAFMRAQAMRVAAPAHWGKLHIVRCSIDMASLPAPVPGNGEDITFVCVGRLSAEKGHRGLLEAFARVRRTAAGCRLVLVGDGPLASELRRLAGELGIDDAVRFTGALAEAATLGEIARADVVVLASFMEGLPVVLIEAAALGKPVIASGVAGIPELVRDRESGLLFPPSDWDALAAAMTRLADDPGLRARLGCAAPATVRGVHDAACAVSPLRALFTGEGTE